MADGPASARERAEAQQHRPRMKPLTDEEYARQHAEAIWYDVRSSHYGRAELRHHHAKINGRLAWRFPYEDRVYVAHRHASHGTTWSVSLWLAPWSAESLHLPREAKAAPVKHGQPLLSAMATLEHAVTGLALAFVGSLCDHGYTRGKDSCPGCDVLDDLYDDLP